MVGSEDALLGRLMLAFRGTSVPPWLRSRLSDAPAAGVTLFRADNIRTPAQVRRLTTGLQAAAATRTASGSDTAAPSGRPLLIAADQEGGQLMALGDGWTPFAGSMAIGATGDADLAERVGVAIGRELRAVGVNVNYAPVLDMATSPSNPSLGIRSFGDDPVAVARLGGAWLRGLQSAGVAATLKHFPGAGGTTADTHHELAIVERDRPELEATDLPPFKAAIEAGARMVMSGHFASPGLTGSRSLPSTLAPEVMTRLLRDELGFEGVSITDALDMRALAQDGAQAVDVIAAIRAGLDLLLATADRRALRRIESTLVRAGQLGIFDADAIAASAARVQALRAWSAGFQDPDLQVVGGVEHLALARELAERSLTLVRDDGALPLRLDPDARVAAIMPMPVDLTPADTSSFVRPGLAAALRNQHPVVDEFVTAAQPTTSEIADLRERIRGCDAVVIGTISASPGSAQAALVEAVVDAASDRAPVVTVALRTPWDLLSYPRAATHACTYSILPDSLRALAAALFGRTAGRDPFPGRLPVRLAGLA